MIISYWSLIIFLLSTGLRSSLKRPALCKYHACRQSDEALRMARTQPPCLSTAARQHGSALHHRVHLFFPFFLTQSRPAQADSATRSGVGRSMQFQSPEARVQSRQPDVSMSATVHWCGRMVLMV
ncbi:hypothetical protein KVR01_004359 [Diaporthe batatas]|uniref:uncharacterized protein n=1 Tax=Diaporthe batatas TaxID=748121 RepID=UPI001D05ABB9|nr:uncharacterized protein KVR01_004359 [Diaporthe batatas]KAG8165807.1 hypothetical protein KVR01_004359 [Diaporthe batatas]